MAAPAGDERGASRRLPSDVGGLAGHGPVDRRDPGHAGWELLAAGVRMALIRRGLFRWDEGRRAVEGLGHGRYARLGYEGRKLAAVEALLVERGVLAAGDLAPGSAAVPLTAGERRALAIGARTRAGPGSLAPRFGAGQRVRVLDADPPGHVRTPAYLRGKAGRVTGVHGPFRNPETLAYGEDGLPPQWLYTVEFRHSDLWGEDATGAGGAVLADLYEHWIDAEEAP